MYQSVNRKHWKISVPLSPGDAPEESVEEESVEGSVTGPSQPVVTVDVSDLFDNITLFLAYGSPHDKLAVLCVRLGSALGDSIIFRNLLRVLNRLCSMLSFLVQYIRMDLMSISVGCF